MAFTIAVNTANADYIIRLTQSDALHESVRKVFTVHNVGSHVQDAMRSYEVVTQASIDEAGAGIDVPVTGASTAVGTSGMFPKIGDQLVLGFYRTHPVDASKTLRKVFVIPAPEPATYDLTTLKPILSRGVDFATALGGADRTEVLGALVDWLETALVYDHDGTRYNGGWTYSEAMSGLISTAREYDGNPLT